MSISLTLDKNTSFWDTKNNKGLNLLSESEPPLYSTHFAKIRPSAWLEIREKSRPSAGLENREQNLSPAVHRSLVPLSLAVRSLIQLVNALTSICNDAVGRVCGSHFRPKKPLLGVPGDNLPGRREFIDFCKRAVLCRNETRCRKTGPWTIQTRRMTTARFVSKGKLEAKFNRIFPFSLWSRATLFVSCFPTQTCRTFRRQDAKRASYVIL